MRRSTLHAGKWRGVALCALALLTGGSNALAGRPLATDDAGTAAAGTCQVETWQVHAEDEHAFVVAPACGVAAGIEFGVDFARPRTVDGPRTQAGMSIKWAPEAWRMGTPVGALNFGLKFGSAFQRPAGSGWHAQDYGALGLATLTPGDEWAVHANLGVSHEPDGGVTATLLNLALVWTPHDSVALFGEGQFNNQRAAFGGTVTAFGGRWWLVKDSVGLDLTTSRQVGPGNGRAWTLGIGWYGLTF